VESTRIVIGLGNPGSEYAATRHNVGFRVLDLLATRGGKRFEIGGGIGRRAWVVEMTEYSEGGLVLAKPRTYMNRSGAAALALCRRYDVAPESLLVVFDDADLVLGRIRLRPEGGSGGHNGIRSMVDSLGTGTFPRIRLGVRGEERYGTDLADYVLEPFAPDEVPVADALIELGADAVEAAVSEGMERAMNLFNGRSVAPTEQTEEE
jgi:PTH1 family peptidyl-tRNA hydrolase